MTVFHNGNLLTTTLNKITFIWEQGTRKFQHFAITEDQKNLLGMVRNLQQELKRAMSLSRHILRPGEPRFDLLGRDPQAPGLVRQWAARRAQAEPRDSKIQSALRIAEQMDAFKRQHPQVGMSSQLMVETPETIRQAAQELVRLAQNNGMTLSISVSSSDGGVQTKIDIGKLEHPAR